MRSVAPQGADRAPDTMNFRKLLSRLQRARGSIACSRELLSGSEAGELAPAVAASIVQVARDCDRQVRQLGRQLTKLNQRDSGASEAVPRRRIPTRRLTIAQVDQQLKSALSLIAKNVRDLPASSYDLRPTTGELSAAKREVSQIRRDCGAILRILPVEES